ncbi:MAG TPA: ATPase [Rhodospirillaceae bacterium]|nr:ATPase [Rhodospirillaceae bacterium]
MPRLADVEARIAGMTSLQGIVGAMRSLAGIRLQEAQQALSGIRGYAQVMRDAIGRALPFIDDDAPAVNDPPGQGLRTLVVLTAEHGFAGGFNERLLEELRPASPELLLILGNRGAAAAAERGLAPAWVAAMPTRGAGAMEAAHRLSREVYARGALARVEVLYNAYCQFGQWKVTRKSILPLDLGAIPPRALPHPPLLNLSPAALLESLTYEYVFAQLMEAMVESIASENAARFAAMQSATDNVEKKLEQLGQEANRVRQEEITTELLDLMVGTEGATAG